MCVWEGVWVMFDVGCWVNLCGFEVCMIFVVCFFFVGR